MAQAFSSAGGIQRVSSSDETLVSVFYRANEIEQDSVVLIHTAPTEPQGIRDVITFATFVSRGTPAALRTWEISLFVLPAAGSVIVAAQGELDDLGHQWRPFSKEHPYPLLPGDQLKIYCTEQGGTSDPLPIDVYIGGIRHIPAA